MNIKFKLLPPLMPNFISYEVPAGKRQDGFKPDSNKIFVGDLSEDDAKEYAEILKQEFIHHWKRKNEQKSSIILH